MTEPCQNSIVLFHEFCTYSNGPDQSKVHHIRKRLQIPLDRAKYKF